MKSFTETRQYQQVLRYVNRIRKELGFGPIKFLRKGRPNELCSCPISNSIRLGHGVNVEVTLHEVEVLHGNGLIRLHKTNPDYVKDFINRFDNDRIPEMLRRW